MPKQNNEIYISTDVETDGPIPGPNSMLSFASVAFSADKVVLGTFTRNLQCLEGSRADLSTMSWWEKNPAAWRECRKHLVEPRTAMLDYVAWLETVIPGEPVFVGYPAAFDFMFVYWYLIRFVGRSPFSFSAIDMKTFAMSRLGTTFRDSSKKNWPVSWLSARPHTHIALDDAYEQGEEFCNMLIQSRSGK